MLVGKQRTVEVECTCLPLLSCHRAACKADMDDSVLPIGIPSFIPTDSCASMAGQSRAAVGADRLYFVTMEDVTKVRAWHAMQADDACSIICP